MSGREKEKEIEADNCSRSTVSGKNDELLKICPQFIKLAAQYVTLCYDTRETHKCW